MQRNATAKSSAASSAASPAEGSDGTLFSTPENALEWLQKRGQTQPRIIVALMFEHGADSLVRHLETAIYQRRSGGMADFWYVLIMWKGCPFIVLSLPATDMEQIAKVLFGCHPGFHLKKGEPHIIPVQDGIPVEGFAAWREGNKEQEAYFRAKIGPFRTVYCFPLTGESVFTIEPLPRPGGSTRIGNFSMTGTKEQRYV